MKWSVLGVIAGSLVATASDASAQFVYARPGFVHPVHVGPRVNIGIGIGTQAFLPGGFYQPVIHPGFVYRPVPVIHPTPVFHPGWGHPGWGNPGWGYPGWGGGFTYQRFSSSWGFPGSFQSYSVGFGQRYGW